MFEHEKVLYKRKEEKMRLLVLLLLGIVLSVCFLLYKFREEELKRQKATKEYLGRNPIPYEINEVVPNLLYLVSLKSLVPKDLVCWPFLKQGVQKLHEKFEIIHVAEKFDEMKTHSFIFLVFVCAKECNSKHENQPPYQINPLIPGALFIVSLRHPEFEDIPLVTPILDEGVEALKKDYEVILVRHEQGFANRRICFVFVKEKTK